MTGNCQFVKISSVVELREWREIGFVPYKFCIHIDTYHVPNTQSDSTLLQLAFLIYLINKIHSMWGRRILHERRQFATGSSHFVSCLIYNALIPLLFYFFLFPLLTFFTTILCSTNQM